MKTTTAAARMHDLTARWVLSLGVTPITAEAHARARDVLVAVEASCADDAAVVAAAMRLACADEVSEYPAEDGAPAMVTASFSAQSLARLATA